MPAPTPDKPGPAPDTAGLRTLRRYYEGTLALPDRYAPVLFVIEAATGTIVLPAEPGTARVRDATLIMPHESDCVLQLMLAASRIDRPEAAEAVDRWKAYHGRSTAGEWVRCSIEGGKTASRVYDADDLMAPNALGSAEFALIKRINAEPASLAGACRRHGAVDVADPLAVGVDEYGVDVRARFGIVRLEFPEGVSARTVESARRAIDWLLAGNPAGPADRSGR